MTEDGMLYCNGHYFIEYFTMPENNCLTTITSKRKLVWYQYQVAKKYTANCYLTKLLQIPGLFTDKC